MTPAHMLNTASIETMQFSLALNDQPYTIEIVHVCFITSHPANPSSTIRVYRIHDFGRFFQPNCQQRQRNKSESETKTDAPNSSYLLNLFIWLMNLV